MKLNFKLGKKGDIELSLRMVLFLILGAIILAIVVGLAISNIMEGNAAVLNLGSADTPLF